MFIFVFYRERERGERDIFNRLLPLARSPQRIPRYKLLLEQLLRATPHEHPDAALLARAAAAIDGVTVHIDSSLLERQNDAKMAQLSARVVGIHASELLRPQRVFVHEGTLLK